jgi:hypothetical protein
MLVELEIDRFISDELDEHLTMLEHNSYPMWFYNNKELDGQAVNHLIHCMKVVSDYYGGFDKPKHFDYTVAER